MEDIYMWWVLAMAWHFGPDDNFVNKSVNRVNNTFDDRVVRDCHGGNPRDGARAGIDS